VNGLNWIVLFVHLVLAPWTVVHALLYKRDPRAAFGWIAVCVLLPLGGPFLYFLFGVNRIRTRALRMGSISRRIGFERGEPSDPQPVPSSIEPEYRVLARVSSGLSSHALVNGNRIETLHNGEQVYPAMLEAIARARETVYLNTYILDADETGTAFMEALAAAHRRGVDVRVIIDGLGEWYSWPRAARRLRRRGVRVARFMPLRLLPPSIHINMRNHHKLLAVDGRVAFTGGMNIGDRHLAARTENPSRVIDLHFRLEGPVALQLRDIFLDTWRFITGDGSRPPAIEPTQDGDLLCRSLTDGPDEDMDRLTMLLLAAISLARSELHIMTPYFLPPREVVAALQAAAVRGVRITVVLPEKNNLPYVHWATRNMLWELLVRDIRVTYQPPPFVHSKLFVVDRRYSLIGSANWDPRSMRLNFELLVEVYGHAFARELAADVDAAAARGRPVTLEEVDGRALPVRLRDAVCWLFSPYL